MSQQKPFTYSWQPPGVKKCFIKGEALRRLRSVPLMRKPLLRKISNISKIARKKRLYPVPIARKYLSELKFADRKTALQQSNKSASEKPLPFVTK